VQSKLQRERSYVMNARLKGVIENIDMEFRDKIQKGSRHHMEVSVGEHATKLGYQDLGKKFIKTFAVVPLKDPQEGMKVRIDGRTFINYAEFDSGIAVPGYLAREAGKKYRTFVPQDSMICNFT